jgi:hypothetical protein
MSSSWMLRFANSHFTFKALECPLSRVKIFLYLPSIPPSNILSQDMMKRGRNERFGTGIDVGDGYNEACDKSAHHNESDSEYDAILHIPVNLDRVFVMQGISSKSMNCRQLEPSGNTSVKGSIRSGDEQLHDINTPEENSFTFHRDFYGTGEVQ